MINKDNVSILLTGSVNILDELGEYTDCLPVLDCYVAFLLETKYKYCMIDEKVADKMKQDVIDMLELLLKQKDEQLIPR